MKRVLFVSCTNYNLEKHGKATVIRGFIDFLKSESDIELEILGIGTQIPGIYNIRLPTSKETILSIPGSLLNLRPLQNAIYYSRKIERKVSKFIKSVDPDIIIYDTMRTAQYAKRDKHRSHSTVYMDDLYSKRYQRVIEFGKLHDVEIDSLGNFSKKLPKLALKISRNSLIQKYLLKYEIKALRRQEKNSVEVYNQILLISEVEADELRKLTSSKNVRSIKPLLDYKVSPRSPKTVADSYFWEIIVFRITKFQRTNF